MARPKTISVTFRCPENLYNNLSNFALDNNIVKDGKPIISEALVAALIIGLETDSHTDVSQDVSQPNNIDFEAIVNSAIAPLLAKIDQLEDDYKDAIINAKHEMRSFVIKGLTSSIDKPYFGVEETSETSLELDIQPIDDAIAPDTAAPSIEKALPDKVLDEAIAATDVSEPLSVTDAIAPNKILTRSDALAIAQNLSFSGTSQNLYDWAKATLNSKSDESKQLNREKLASVGLAPVTRDDGKIAWIAISVMV
jgi:hypothetical protein